MEDSYSVKDVEPILLFGANNQRIKEIINLFPKLKIVVRGNELKINGNEKEINKFRNKLDVFVAHILRYGALTENQLERLMGEDGEEIVKDSSGDETILFGVGGKAIKAITANQRKMVVAMKNDDLLEVADALTDILYVTYGAGHAFGIDLDKCFEEIQNSNMSKLGEGGKPIYNESGKVMKGPKYFKPDLTKFVK